MNYEINTDEILITENMKDAILKAFESEQYCKYHFTQNSEMIIEKVDVFFDGVGKLECINVVYSEFTGFDTGWEYLNSEYFPIDQISQAVDSFVNRVNNIGKNVILSGMAKHEILEYYKNKNSWLHGLINIKLFHVNKFEKELNHEKISNHIDWRER